MQPKIAPMGEHDVAAVAQLRLATFFEGTEGRSGKMRQGFVA